jgi:hypothetical protein
VEDGDPASRADRSCSFLALVGATEEITMKIVFAFHGKPQVALSGHAYNSMGKQPLSWHGAFIEGLIADGPTPFKPEGDALYIEGSLASMRSIVDQLSAQLDSLEKTFRAEIDAKIDRQQQCEICSMWFDKNHRRHGDGRGLDCLGDGTAVMGSRLVLMNGVDVDFTMLKKGDRFKLKDPISDYERARTYEALSNAGFEEGSGHASVLVRRDE